MENEFEECIEKKKLKKIKPDKETIKKELNGSNYDFLRARKSFEEEDFKWATIQCYYAAFHAAKAFIVSKGLIEKNHYCLLMAFKELAIKNGLMKKEFYEYFNELMNLREEADYGLEYLSQESAGLALKETEEFLKEIKKHIKVNSR